MLLEFFDHRRMPETDHALQQFQLLREPERPALGQTFVVELFGRHAGELFKAALRV